MELTAYDWNATLPLESGRIAARTVGRWLRAERIRPWRDHAWQHLHDPVSFLHRARPVLQASGQARALLQEGNRLLSVAEKTSMQARAGEQPPRPACPPGKPLLHKARSHRRGARHLCAGLAGASGQVYGTCRQRKGCVAFQAFVHQRVIPEALQRKVQTVTFILDHGTTHAPQRLESWLREQEQACEGQLHLQLLWLPPNAFWLDQIAIWFSLLQRNRLQPNHFVTTTALATALTDSIAYDKHTAQPINWTYTVQKLEQKLGAHL